jgi:hypothetical protein
MNSASFSTNRKESPRKECSGRDDEVVSSTIFHDQANLGASDEKAVDQRGDMGLLAEPSDFVQNRRCEIRIFREKD